MRYLVTWYDGIGHAVYFDDKLKAMAEYIRVIWKGGTSVILSCDFKTVWTTIKPVVPTPELPF